LRTPFSFPAIVAVILVLFAFAPTAVRADGTTCSSSSPCYFGYNPSGTYIPWAGPFPSYWSENYQGQTVKVTTATITISVQGFPSDYSTALLADGKSVASIAGGGTAKFQIKGDDIHTYQVDSYVSGKSGERFYAKGTSWTSERGKDVSVTSYTEYYTPYYAWWDYSYTDPYWYYYYPYYVPTTQTVTQPFDQSYTFTYETQYQLTVQNARGGSSSPSGWYAKDSSVNLNTDPMTQATSDTREMFVAWNLNGANVNSPQTTITMDQPYTATAVYHKQYYVEVKSDYGNPTGSGWYDEGSTATVQVESELAAHDAWQALGSKMVFDHWSVGGSTSNPASITVDSPKTVEAIFREDMTTPTVVIILLLLALIAAAVLARRRGIRTNIGTTLTKTKLTLKPQRPEEAPTQILRKRYASGEISREDYQKMLKDLGDEKA
jgi:hypothetical protein